MNTQHTPGPWLYDIDRNKTQAVINDADGYIVAELKPTLNTTAHTGLEANTRLMAAAPDMLEALIRIQAWWTGTPGFQEGEDEMPAGVFDAMRYALAKATYLPREN